MENLSSNERKVLANMSECIKIDVPALAKKTDLSKPTVRSIVNRITSSGIVFPYLAYVPWKMGLDIMTVYEVTYPAIYQSDELEKHINGVLNFSENAVIVLKINPSQSVIVAFYKDLEQKDSAFSKTMKHVRTEYGADFPVNIKELWTRPSKDFYYDANIRKLLYAAECSPKAKQKNGGKR